MDIPQEPPLDEMQWRAPHIAQSMGGIHTNSGKYALDITSDPDTN
jgi:hypothetical protein